MTTIEYRISKCFWKDSFYGMVCYAILCYGMEWKVWYEISMLCYEISMLWYDMVYVVKDKQSATVFGKWVYHYEWCVAYYEVALWPQGQSYMVFVVPIIIFWFDNGLPYLQHAFITMRGFIRIQHYHRSIILSSTK